MPRAVVRDGQSLVDEPEESRTAVAEPVSAVSVVNIDALFGAPSYLGTREEIQAELDAMAALVRRFYQLPPDLVMRYCAAFSSRLTELAVLLHRVESRDRQYTRVRTQQVERWLAELDRQFKTASRIVEVLRQDTEQSRRG